MPSSSSLADHDDDNSNFFTNMFDDHIEQQKPINNTTSSPSPAPSNKQQQQNQLLFKQALTNEQQQQLYRLTQLAIDFFQNHLQQPIWATAGTALGALRHQAIIPWDDDVDLATIKSPATNFLIRQVQDSHEFLKRHNMNNNSHQHGTSGSRTCNEVDDDDRRRDEMFYFFKTDDDEHENTSRNNKKSSFPCSGNRLRSSNYTAAEAKITSLLEEFETKHHVRIAKADRVGLRFYDLTNSSVISNYPFVDIFVYQKIQNFSLLRKKDPVVARKIEPIFLPSSEGNEDDHEDEQDNTNTTSTSSINRDRAFFIIDDPIGRLLWPTEIWSADTIPKINVMKKNGTTTNSDQSPHLSKFGPLFIPLADDTEEFLNRVYGSDWRTVARSHTIDHLTKEVRHDIVEANVKDVV